MDNSDTDASSDAESTHHDDDNVPAKNPLILEEPIKELILKYLGHKGRANIIKVSHALRLEYSINFPNTIHNFTISMTKVSAGSRIIIDIQSGQGVMYRYKYVENPAGVTVIGKRPQLVPDARVIDLALNDLEKVLVNSKLVINRFHIYLKSNEQQEEQREFINRMYAMLNEKPITIDTYRIYANHGEEWIASLLLLAKPDTLKRVKLSCESKKANQYFLEMNYMVHAPFWTHLENLAIENFIVPNTISLEHFHHLHTLIINRQDFNIDELDNLVKLFANVNTSRFEINVLPQQSTLKERMGLPSNGRFLLLIPDTDQTVHVYYTAAYISFTREEYTPEVGYPRGRLRWDQ